MGRKAKFNVADVEAALRATGGIYSLAAAWIEKKKGVGCAPNTIKNYVTRSKSLQKAMEEIEQITFDEAVHQLVKQIMNGNLTAIIYYINRKGHKFGWANKVEIEATLKTEPSHSPHLKNLQDLPIEEQRKILEIMHRAQAQHDEDGDAG